jgi:hypothetical protein
MVDVFRKPVQRQRRTLEALQVSLKAISADYGLASKMNLLSNMVEFALSGRFSKEWLNHFGIMERKELSLC